METGGSPPSGGHARKHRIACAIEPPRLVSPKDMSRIATQHMTNHINCVARRCHANCHVAPLARVRAHSYDWPVGCNLIAGVLTFASHLANHSRRNPKHNVSQQVAYEHMILMYKIPILAFSFAQHYILSYFQILWGKVLAT